MAGHEKTLFTIPCSLFLKEIMMKISKFIQEAKEEWKKDHIKVVCANCEKEGKPSFMKWKKGTIKGIEHPVSHGICEKHLKEVLNKKE